jgi:hypothetical protein
VIIKPATISRRGFLQGALGIATTIVFPHRPLGYDWALAAQRIIEEKEAIDKLNELVRVQMREDGFWRRILPPLPIQNDMLDRSVSTTKPCILRPDWDVRL